MDIVSDTFTLRSTASTGLRVIRRNFPPPHSHRLRFRSHAMVHQDETSLDSGPESKVSPLCTGVLELTTD